MNRRSARAALAVLATLSLSIAAGGCSTDEPAATTTITVFAAASLTDVLADIATQYEAQHPGVDIVTSYGGSADLASQINEGAPADVFISADAAHMEAVASLVAGTPVLIGSNRLTIAVPAGNPAGITGLGNFSRADLDTVVCAPHVPCGSAALALADALGVPLRPASEEQSVSDVIGKVASGQADAGLVYVTDIARAEGVDEVPIPGTDAGTNGYFAATLQRSSSPQDAADFVAYLASDNAQAMLASAGFGAP